MRNRERILNKNLLTPEECIEYEAECRRRAEHAHRLFKRDTAELAKQEADAYVKLRDEKLSVCRPHGFFLAPRNKQPAKTVHQDLLPEQVQRIMESR